MGVEVGGGDRDFFFRAENGIRDLVRSRVLGDVYKKQVDVVVVVIVVVVVVVVGVGVVAYTHLTLPTKRIV
mgnify:CR=1 FL=1